MGIIEGLWLVIVGRALLGGMGNAASEIVKARDAAKAKQQNEEELLNERRRKRRERPIRRRRDQGISEDQLRDALGEELFQQLKSKLERREEQRNG